MKKLIVAGVFGLVLLIAPPASAHASVVASDPIDGSRLKSAPAAVSVTFDQAANGLPAIIIGTRPRKLIFAQRQTSDHRSNCTHDFRDGSRTTS